jgi:CRISPR-associated protein Cmr6
MQELQDDGEVGFTDEAINALFGPETVNQPEDAQRGALDFWDVFPQPAGNKLVVEIMTPHFGKYYQGTEPPHDSGAPIPVSFLAVPAKSQFDFHVVCQPSRLTAALQDQWRALLDRAFQHAFEWVGFGAKTSVGYGAMAATAAVSASSPAHTQGADRTVPIAAESNSKLQTWPTAKLTLNPSTGEVTASYEGKSTTALRNLQANELRAALGDERANRLKKNKELKGVSVDVEPLGNALMIKRLTPS